MTDGGKVCSQCGEAKPVSDFGPLAHCKDGLRPSCKPCARKQQRAYRLRRLGEERDCSDCGVRFVVTNTVSYCQPCVNRRDRERRQRFWAENPEAAHLRKKDRHLRHQYGITLVDYDAMLAEQGGGCAVCGVPSSGDRKLSVDHCHTSGRVRGLLCSRCNYALGLLDDRPELMRQAATYLEAS